MGAGICDRQQSQHSRIRRQSASGYSFGSVVGVQSSGFHWRNGSVSSLFPEFRRLYPRLYPPGGLGNQWRLLVPAVGECMIYQ